jgi:light-harvesting complex 1 alpha chain
MPPRSSVRTNIVLFTILGFIVALLIHFVVLSSPRYNWLEQAPEAMNALNNVAMYILPALLLF